LQKKSWISLRKILSAAAVLIFVPATVLFGVYGLGDRKFLITSLLVLTFSILSFFLVFEHRKPQARDLVTLSVLCALTVAGRAAFFLLPQIKPVAAIVIITGVCLGGESGFFVGAVSAFVSNFFFGQGPNTPWQMFGFGIIGFLAGLLFSRSLLKPNRLTVCVFGGLSTFLLYGGIVNLGTLLISGLDPTLPAYLTFCAAALPFDLLHAASSVVFLYFLSQPMTEKLRRMKTKYGILEP
jgi:energy-coupling factor transport system substrate-specific component